LPCGERREVRALFASFSHPLILGKLLCVTPVSVRGLTVVPVVPAMLVGSR